MAFRQFITLRTKFQFEWLLQQRSYSGKLLLDHTNQNLHLKVDPRAGEVHDNSLTQVLLMVELQVVAVSHAHAPRLSYHAMPAGEPHKSLG